MPIRMPPRRHVDIGQHGLFAKVDTWTLKQNELFGSGRIRRHRGRGIQFANSECQSVVNHQRRRDSAATEGHVAIVFELRGRDASR
jgi:hypothetical protein